MKPQISETAPPARDAASSSHAVALEETAGHHAPAAIRTRDLWLRSSAKKVGATEGPSLARKPDAETPELLAEVYAKKPAPAPRYSNAGPAVQLEPCDACARIGELVQVLVPNPRPLSRRRIGEPEMLSVRVHAKTCQSERRLKAAARYVLGGGSHR